MKILLILASILVLSFVGVVESFGQNEPNTENFVVMKDQFGYNIPYTITNGTINQITMDCKAWSLVFEINSKESGILEVDISKELMDPLWSVLVDYEELQQGNVTENTVTVWFPTDTKQIEFLGGGVFTLESGSCKKIHNPPYSFLLSPIKQMKNGVIPNDIICKEDLVVVSKNDNSPACVKPSTAEKLIERGWSMDSLDKFTDSVSIETNRGNFTLNYFIEGGNVKEVKNEYNSIIFSIEPSRDGELTLIAPNSPESGTITYFLSKTAFILLDGEEISFRSFETSKFSKFVIPFNENSNQIEVIGVFVPSIKEFPNYVLIGEGDNFEGYLVYDENLDAYWKSESFLFQKDGTLQMNINAHYLSDFPEVARIRTGGMDFAQEQIQGTLQLTDSIMFVSLRGIYEYASHPNETAAFDSELVPIFAKSMNDTSSNFQYKGKFTMPKSDLGEEFLPLNLRLNMGWLRVYENENDKRYYEWVTGKNYECKFREKSNVAYFDESLSLSSCLFGYYPKTEYATDAKFHLENILAKSNK